jgi:putative colanic acid biosynthesis UDP-glucose lipid carrier transferase
MLSNRSIGFRSLTALVLLVLVTCSYWGWLCLWENVAEFGSGALQKYFLYNEFLLIGVVFGLGSSEPAHGPHQEFRAAVRRSGRQAIFGFFGVLALVVSLQDTFVSRSFLVSFVPWLLLTLFFANYIAPKWLGKWAFSGTREERVALAGTVEQACQVRPWLERKRVIGLNSVGVISPQPATGLNGNGHVVGHANGNGNGKGNANGNGNSNETSFRVLGSLDDMGKILSQEAITQVIVLDLSLGPERLRKMTQICEDATVRLLALDRLDTYSNYFNHSTTIHEEDGMRIIGLREEPLESPINRFTKRALDLAIALPVVVFLLPITTFIVWLCQCAQSPGPVIFRQERVGMMGQRFLMFKYRTMHVNNGDENKQASKQDDRIYPAGRWFRKSSLDELPQFVNVLLGDMSVVGPRPHLQKHEELWIRAMRKYVIRRFVRPGITGYAQVNGFRGEVRSDADVQNRVERDIYYLENWSFSLDVVIVLKTIRDCIIPHRNAY